MNASSRRSRSGCPSTNAARCSGTMAATGSGSGVTSLTKAPTNASSAASGRPCIASSAVAVTAAAIPG